MLLIRKPTKQAPKIRILKLSPHLLDILDLVVSFIRLLLQKIGGNMFWTLELASYLEEAPWPATKDELIDYSIRSGAPIEVVENLQELEDEGEVYESIEDIWPDYPSQEDFMFNEDEY